jgi:hypothetical protein
MSLVAAIAFSVAVVVACVGWGRLAEEAVGRRLGGPPLPRLSTGVAGCIGLAVFLCGSGLLVAVDLFVMWLAWLWVAAGCALALRATGLSPLTGYRHVRPSPLEWRRRITPLGVVAVAVLGIQAVYLASEALGNAPWNGCDDYPGYLAFVERLVETGGMIEPFSLRRISGPGSGFAFQALFTGTLGADAAFVADLVCGGLLVGLLLLPLSPRAPRLALGALLVIAFTLWESLQRNLSPTYLVVALIAAGLLVVVDTRRTRADLLDPRVLALVGLLGAGLLTMRASAAVPVALFGGALVVRATGARVDARIRATAVLGLAMVVPAVPWMVALWRSSDTPLYPAVNGNLEPSWPGFRDSGADLGGKLLDTLAFGELWWVLAAVGVAGVALVLLVRRRAWAEVPLLALPGVAITTIITLVSLSALLPFDHARYAWPLLAAVLVAALAMLADEAGMSLGSARGVFSALIVSAIAVGLTIPDADRRAGSTLDEIGDTVAAAADIASGDTPHPPGWQADPSEVNFASIPPGSRDLDDYAAAQAALPAGAKVAATTDFPFLFDLDRNDFVSLDVLGSVSSAPGLPFGGTSEDKTAYLREQGFDYVVATDPDESRCLYSRNGWEAQLASNFVPLSKWAPFFLDWFAWLDSRAVEDPTLYTRRGTLQIFDLDPAR